MLWIALHLPHLSLESCAAARDPAQALRPLVLLHEHRVQQADAAALALGVRPGMKRATALALAPDLLLAQADARRDARALRAVAHVALGFSPSVVWALPVPGLPDAQVGVRLEVQSCLRYFGGLAPLLQRLREALAPLGHQAHIATAPTALGAALLAGWRNDLAQGAHSTGREALQTLLDALPLALLGAGAQHAEALQGMGLHTLADLRGLPRDGLARRFGPELLAEIDRARGHAPEAHAWLSLPPRFASRLELMCRADTSAQVLAGAQVLLARLMAWAGAQQARIARFVLVMHHEPLRHSRKAPVPERSTLDIALAEPVADATHLHSLLAERLGRLPLVAPALELSLTCDQIVLASAPNGELFASRRSEREGLSRLVERLQARLGVEQVQRLGPLADRRPEHYTRWQSADPARLGTAMAATADDALAARALSAQPLWLLKEPQALVERGQQLLLDGRPLQLLAGPERLETGWWDTPGPVLRDYFIAQAASGALVWIYRHRLPADDGQPHWFLQGLFG
jgi:protein ImuB